MRQLRSGRIDRSVRNTLHWLAPIQETACRAPINQSLQSSRMLNTRSVTISHRPAAIAAYLNKAIHPSRGGVRSNYGKSFTATGLVPTGSVLTVRSALRSSDWRPLALTCLAAIPPILVLASRGLDYDFNVVAIKAQYGDAFETKALLIRS